MNFHIFVNTIVIGCYVLGIAIAAFIILNTAYNLIDMMLIHLSGHY